MPPRVLRVKPDAPVSIHGLAPGYFPHFQNPENISDGVYKRVLGTIDGNCQVITLFSLW